MIAAGRTFADEQRSRLINSGFSVEIARSMASALERLTALAYDALVVQWRTVEVEFLGRDWRDAWNRCLRLARRRHANAAIVVLAEPGSRLPEEVRTGTTLVLSGLDAARIAEVLPERAEKFRLEEFLQGESTAMKRVCALVRLVADRDIGVLISGETGAGKDHVALAIHRLGPAGWRDLITVSCGGVSAAALDTEIFGGDSKGRLQGAAGGTILFDEIDELPRELQGKLARALGARQMLRTGTKGGTRVLATTRTDLERQVDQGTFRADLLYRLNQFPIHVPALRERRTDIPDLVRHFLDRFCRRENLPAKRATPEAEARLMERPWPGNLRELQNVAEYAAIRSGDRREIRVEDFPEAPPRLTETGNLTESVGEAVRGSDLVTLVARYERRLIEQALGRAQGNKKRAAEILGVKRTTLIEKLKRMRPAPGA